jgi:O-acetylserine/cysteine efflux transporter
MLVLPFKDILLAIGVAVCWAFNLVVIKWTIQGISPLTFGCLRFVFVAFPLVFFLPRPKIPLGKLIAIGLLLGVAKFALMFKGLELGISIGMCALTLQTQVIFTAIFSYFMFGYHLSKREIAGIFLALCGIAMLAAQTQSTSSLMGFVIVLCSALSWGLSNNISRTLKDVNILQLTVWMSLVPPLPYFLLSQIWEGPTVFFDSLQIFGWNEVLATAYIVIVATLFGLTGWTWLMRQHNPARVSIYGLLIPVFSLFFGWLCFDETLSSVSMIACSTIFVGLVINQWPRSAKGSTAEFAIQNAA